MASLKYGEAIEKVKDAAAQRAYAHYKLTRSEHKTRHDVESEAKQVAQRTIARIRPSVSSAAELIAEFSRYYVDTYKAVYRFWKNQNTLDLTTAEALHA